MNRPKWLKFKHSTCIIIIVLHLFLTHYNAILTFVIVYLLKWKIQKKKYPATKIRIYKEREKTKPTATIKIHVEMENIQPTALQIALYSRILEEKWKKRMNQNEQIKAASSMINCWLYLREKKAKHGVRSYVWCIQNCAVLGIQKRAARSIVMIAEDFLCSRIESRTLRTIRNPRAHNGPNW